MQVPVGSSYSYCLVPLKCNGHAFVGWPGVQGVLSGGASYAPDRRPAKGKAAKLNDVAALKERLIACSDESEVAQILHASSLNLRPAAFTLLITALGKRGDIEKAKAVFAAVPQPNVWHHTALIAAHASAGDWLAAVDHLQHLKALAAADAELAPNTITYSTAIEACARSHHMDIAQELYQEMDGAGLEPDSVTYAILLTHFSRGAAWDQVESLLEEMHSKAMPARTTIYTVYIKELARTLQWNKALGLVMVMQELGAEVTPVIYNELLQVLCKCGKPLMTAQVLQQAYEDNAGDCSTLLDASLSALLSSGFYNEAQTLHSTMVDNGWPASSTVLPDAEEGEPLESPAVPCDDIQLCRTSSTISHGGSSLAYSEDSDSLASECSVPPAAAGAAGAARGRGGGGATAGYSPVSSPGVPPAHKVSAVPAAQSCLGSFTSTFSGFAPADADGDADPAAGGDGSLNPASADNDDATATTTCCSAAAAFTPEASPAAPAGGVQYQKWHGGYFSQPQAQLQAQGGQGHAQVPQAVYMTTQYGGASGWTQLNMASPYFAQPYGPAGGDSTCGSTSPYSCNGPICYAWYGAPYTYMVAQQ